MYPDERPEYNIILMHAVQFQDETTHSVEPHGSPVLSAT